jgi:hypothetical protein
LSRDRTGISIHKKESQQLGKGIARTRPWLQALSASSILERAVDRSVVPRDVQAEVTKWVRDIGVSEKDMEVLTANDNADEDHSAMFEEIFLKYGNTPQGEAMILDGARESLDRWAHSTMRSIRR